MAKKNVLKNFANYSITKKESDNLKGGRSSNPINTGSTGFINWDDIEVRRPNIASGSKGSNIKKIGFF